MAKQLDAVPHVFEITVERERTIVERRTVRAVAYTSKSAVMLAKQRRPREGWKEVNLSAGANSETTTRFLAVQETKDLGEVDGFPVDPEAQNAFLNDRALTVVDDNS